MIPWDQLPELSPGLEEMVPRFAVLKEYDPAYVEKLRGLLERGRRFARAEVYPRALELDARVKEDPRYFDWEIVKKGLPLRMLSLGVPEPAGGEGHLTTGMALLIEELCAGCAGIALIFGAHALGFSAVGLAMDMEILDRFLAPIVEKEKRGEPHLFALDITEPSAGSDVEDAEGLAKARLTLQAKKVSGGYLLNGRKCFISNGSVAHCHFVTAAVDKLRPLESFTAFVVPADSPGLSIGRWEQKMGQRACPAAEVIYEDVFVPEKNVLGVEGEGMYHTLTVLSASRGPVGAIATGIARGAFERAWAYAQATRRNGRRLIEEEWVQMRLADMIKDIHLARQAVMDATMFFDFFHVPRRLRQPRSRLGMKLFPRALRTWPPLHDRLDWKKLYAAAKEQTSRDVTSAVRSRAVILSSLAKVAGSDLAMGTCRKAMEILGEEGPIREWGIEKCWRDAKLTQIYEGTNQLNRAAMVKEVLQPGSSEKLPAGEAER
ncbi:MAG: hypothetical protein A2V67_07270 [Deltaproteobacteria bacterium RBG_13_61_14]|nr:MAG: hypothetical protein A2V67_07270 [Deltaproteobacteria bacterium RBG_13_61_14]